MSFLPSGHDALTAKETGLGTGEMGSGVKGIACFSRGLELDSQHQHGCSQLPVASVLPYLTPSSGWCMDIIKYKIIF